MSRPRGGTPADRIEVVRGAVTAADGLVLVDKPSGVTSHDVGSYGIAPGIIYSYPCRCKNGDYEIVQGLAVSDFSREKMAATEAELREERAAVEHLLK